MSKNKETPVFDMADKLGMLLNAVAEYAAKSGIKDASRVLALDEYAQAHFIEVSSELKAITGLDMALIEYGKEKENLRKNVIDYNKALNVRWPILNRIV